METILRELARAGILLLIEILTQNIAQNIPISDACIIAIIEVIEPCR